MAGRHLLGRKAGRHVLQARKAAAGSHQEVAGVEAVGVAGVGIDEQDLGGTGGHHRSRVDAHQAHDPRARRRDATLRARRQEDRRRSLGRVHLSHEPRDIDERARGLGAPVLGPRLDRVEGAPAAMLEAHGHQDAGREGGGEEIAEAIVALDLLRIVAADLGREPAGIVVLGEAHGRRQPGQHIFLVEQPGRAEVPPAAAVEHVVEAAVGELPELIEGAAQRRGEKEGILVLDPEPVDERAPEIGRDLVGCAAAQPRYSELQEMTGQAREIVELSCPVVRLGEIELGQVEQWLGAMRCGRIGNDRRHQVARRITVEPIGMGRGEVRLGRRMGQHEVGHHPQPVVARRSDEAADERRCLTLLAIPDEGMQLERIRDGVDAAGAAGGEEGVDVHPVEPHPGDARQVLRPAGDASGEQREEVVDTWSVDDGRLTISFGCQPPSVSRVAGLVAEEQPSKGR